ncbi:adenosine deaminase/editase [Geopyxis carbonaria]|nr:adenosine deaminase/editase [Geopyxis carbonaria]
MSPPPPQSQADIIAHTVLAAFDALPLKRKPQLRSDGTTEWVPVAGIVLEDTDCSSDSDSDSGRWTCVALGTGTKVLAVAKIPLARGHALHDSHAEVEWFLLAHCRLASQSPDGCTPFVTANTASSSAAPYALRARYKIHFYTSEAPCGDSSMELTMSAQADATAWTPPAPSADDQPAAPLVAHLRGRGYFAALGAVRTKPGRADSPETLSKSCSDKLAVHQCLSLLLAAAAHLVAPDNVYIATLVLPASQHTPAGCERAWGRTGRLAALDGRAWTGGYAFRPFAVATTALEFAFSKRVVGPVASNMSAVMVRGVGDETLIGGVLQGRKQFSGARAGSMVCKAKLWAAAAAAAPVPAAATYAEIKEGGGATMRARRRVKDDVRRTLGGWVRNGGNDFAIGTE